MQPLKQEKNKDQDNNLNNLLDRCYVKNIKPNVWLK